MTYFHVSLAQPSHSSAGQSRTLMSHSMVFVWQATWCILNKVPFTRGKKSIIVHLQRAPTACRQLSHLLSVWAGPFPTMKMAVQDKNSPVQQWSWTLQFTKNRENWHFSSPKQWNQSGCWYCPSQICRALLVLGMAWMPPGMHITLRRCFLWTPRTALKHWSLTVEFGHAWAELVPRIPQPLQEHSVEPSSHKKHMQGGYQQVIIMLGLELSEYIGTETHCWAKANTAFGDTPADYVFSLFSPASGVTTSKFFIFQLVPYTPLRIIKILQNALTYILRVKHRVFHQKEKTFIPPSLWESMMDSAAKMSCR